MQPLIDFFLAHWVAYSAVAGVFLLNWIFARKSQIDAWCEARPRVAGILKTLRGFGIDPWTIRQGLVLILTGKLPVGYKVLAAKLQATIGPETMANQIADTKAIVAKEAARIGLSQ